jgi:hypothetical protein
MNTRAPGRATPLVFMDPGLALRAIRERVTRHKNAANHAP